MYGMKEGIQSNTTVVNPSQPWIPFSPPLWKGATELTVPLRARHDYDAAQEQAWDEAIRRDLRTPDDGVPLPVLDWLDLNALACQVFLSPKDDDQLWEWRQFAVTDIQRITARRLVRHGLIVMCDADKGYCRLSARGLRKVSSVWRHLLKTVVEARESAAVL